MPWPTCDVCGKPAKGVASSVLGAFSLAYCQRCLEEHAEPLDWFHATLDCIGGPERAAEWVKDLRSYKDGQYIDWPDIIAAYTPSPDDYHTAA